MRQISALILLALLMAWAPTLPAASDAEIEAYLRKGGSSRSASVSGKSESLFGFDLSGTASMIDLDFLNTKSAGTSLDWTGDDVKGDDWQFGLGARLFFRLADHKINLSYQGMVLESFSDASTRSVDFGAATIPAGSDLDARISLHHFILEDITMPWQVDAANDWRMGYSWGFGYDIVRMGLNSDAFPIAEDSQKMQEMLPYPVVGLHLEWKPGGRASYGLSGRVGYLPEISTFQKRNGEKLNQETLFAEIALYESWKINPWFVIGGTIKYQTFDHKLVGDGATASRTEQTFEYSALVLSLDLGVRF